MKRISKWAWIHEAGASFHARSSPGAEKKTTNEGNIEGRGSILKRWRSRRRKEIR